MIYIDANVILRYLLKDDESFFVRSKEIIENEKVYIIDEIIVEVVYVLNKTYGINRNEIRDVLKKLFSKKNFNVRDENIIFEALDIFSDKNVDYVDAVLYSINKIYKQQVITFDKKLNKLIKI